MKFGIRVGNWDALPHKKFCENHLRGKFIPNITIFGDFGGHKPTLISK